uniref:Kelch-like protein diablo n=1 Tax=Cacopsylla melanoneura TaxID=428564 RepID=A0A8D8TAL0_9HEMI
MSSEDHNKGPGKNGNHESGGSEDSSSFLNHPRCRSLDSIASGMSTASGSDASMRNYVQDNLIYTHSHHGSSCLDKMETMLRSRKLTDVVLKAGQFEIPAHRLVLSASCEYFSIMFTGDMREVNENVITINGIDADTLVTIVDYCYTGSIEVTEDNVENILSAACLLQLPDIVSACSTFLIKQLHPSNCIGIYMFADAQGCFQIQASAESYIAEHFNEVRKSKEFLSLSHTHMAKLLSSEELNIDSEEDTYSAVMHWLYHDIENRKDNMSDLLSYIKLPLISQQFLVDTVEKDPVLRDDIHCRTLIMEAITYHLLPERRPLLQSSRTRPRPSTLDKIYVLGGADPGNREAMSIEVFEIRANTWTEIGHLRNRRLQFGAGVLNGKIHVVGGRDGLKTVNTFEYLDTHSRGKDTEVTWVSRPSMLTHRHGLGVGVLEPDGPLYAVGGHDGWSYLNTTERWDPRLGQWSFIAPMLLPRSTAGVAVLNSKLYAVGGRDGSSCLRTAEMYDPLTNTWYTIASMGKRRSSVGLAALGGCLYAVGGHEGSIRFKSVERYDPREDVWRTVTSMSIGRDAVSVATLGDRLVAIGGYDGQNYLPLTEIFDPLNNTWTPLSTLNLGRAGACAMPVTRSGNTMC